MISVEKKFIIITPPKNASVTLVDALREYIIIDNIKYDTPDCFDYSDCFSETSKHTGISQMFESWNEDRLGKFDEYKIYGVVRCPYDRLISRWKWDVKVIGKHFSYLRKLNFEKYIQTYIGREAPIIPEEKWWDQRTNQVEYLTINNIMIADKIIKVESLQADFNEFCDDVGIPRKDLPKRNTTKQKPVVCNTDVKNMVYNCFKRDFIEFDYKPMLNT